MKFHQLRTEQVRTGTDSATGTKINKNVSSKDYYAYRLMIG
jgi:hypothetical protein